MVGYEELEEEAQERGIESKPFIARYVAERLEYNTAEEGWQKFGQLAEQLARLADPEAAAHPATGTA
jgi:hypothetical protein